MVPKLITIDLLKNHPSAIPSLASIWSDVLGKIWVPNVSSAEVQERFKNHLNDDTLPLTYVAFHNNEPVGMCSLRENDGIRPDLKPWIGSLVVDSQYQNQGIGRKLLNITLNKAKNLGFKTVHLFAFDPTIPEYYKSLGWKIIGIDECKGHPVTVMMIEL